MKKVSEFFCKIRKWADSHKTLFALIITALFIISQIPLLLTHENWSDEAISWGLSKEITLSNIYEMNSAEPHPFLWQFILAPFSKLGMSFEMISLISLAIVALAVFLLVRFAPMNFFVKLLFILSCGFFYYNSIIARNYSLIPLAICLICIAYKKRHEKPLLYGLSVAFLTQTHFLMYGFAGALALGFVIEETFGKKGAKSMIKNILVFSIPVLIAIGLSVPMIFGSLQNQPVIAGKYEFDEYTFENSFKSIIGNYVGFYMHPIAIIIVVLFSLFILTTLADNIKLALYIIFGIATWVYIIFTRYYIYHVFEQKLSMIILMIMAVVWISYIESDKKRTNIFKRLFSHLEIMKYFLNRLKSPAIVFAAILLSFSAPRTINEAIYDYNDTFTNGKNVADYIKNNFEDGSLIIEADASAANDIEFDILLRLQDKNYIYYNALYRDIVDDYMVKMRYNMDYFDKEVNFKRFTDDELSKLLEKYKKEYDHIYLFMGIPSCENALPYNYNVLNAYEEMAVINNGDYVPTVEKPIRVYRIK